MKKILCVLLCLCLLLPAALVLSSCKKTEGDGTVTVSKKTATVEVKNYTIIKPSDYSDVSGERLNYFANLMKTKVGVAMRVVVDAEASPVTTTTREILIGKVNRTETEKAMKKIKGDGYIITVTDNKIVIAGTTNTLTAIAVEYFIQNYIPAEKSNGTITLAEQTLLSNNPMMEVTTADGTTSYSVVYNASLDADTGSAEGDSPATSDQNPDSVDIPVACAKSGTSVISKLTGIKRLTRKNDKADADGPEIIYGVTNRADMKTVLAGMNAREYGVVAINGNIAVASWTDTGLRKASLLMEGVLKDSVVETNGTKRILVPANLRIVYDLNNNWVTEFTKPTGDGIELSEVFDIGDESIQYYYKGSGVGAAYTEYCKTLEGEGYTLYTDNTKEDNIYRTYISKDNKHTLYVVYSAYKYAAEQNVGTYVPSIRIISAPMSAVNLVEKEVLSGQKYTKIADTSITTVRMAYTTGNFGMDYVIMLEDGSFIVYDGGGNGQTNAANDHVRLYNVLVDLFTRAHGNAPTKDNPIVIAGWILTHQHWDHISVFRDFCNSYGSKKQVRIEALYANFISESEAFNAYNPDFSLSSKLQTYVDLTGGLLKYYKLHTGMKLQIRNATLEVLYTHEDMTPRRIYYFNDSSTIVRFTFRDSESRNETTATFLGDLYKYGSRVLRALHGASLKCDIVQVAHHGYQGCEKELYQLFSPELLLWPTSSNEWNAQTNAKAGTSSSWWYQVDYFLANQLSSVKYIIVQDIQNTTLTLTNGRPDYDNLYSPVDGGKIEFEERKPTGNFLIKK